MKLSSPLTRILIFALVFCVDYSFAQNTEYPEPFLKLDSQGVIYKANLEFEDKSINGNLAMNLDSTGFNVVLFSITGFTFFDFTIGANKVHWRKIPEYLDRKRFLKVLENDFRLLLLTPLKFGKIKKKNLNSVICKTTTGRSVAYEINNGNIEYGKLKSLFSKLRTEANYHYDFEEYPQSIEMKKSGLDMRIYLELKKD